MRLYIMQMGNFARIPEDGSLREDIPVPAYLIQTNDGTNVLVDTGFSSAAIAAAKEPGYTGPLLGQAIPVTDALAQIGVRPEDVRYLVATHFDPDHAGGTDLFPNAEIVVQQAHYDAAKSGQHQRYQMTRTHWDIDGLHYRFINGDTELLPGIELIESSGHAPGHQSLLVRLPETGPVLLAIDAITRNPGDMLPEERPDNPMDVDSAAARVSVRKLTDLADREGVTLIVYGHDANEWKTLKKSPEYYQ